MTIEFVLAEFGDSRGNAGDGTLPVERLEPSLSSFLKHFPEATVTVYTDQPWEGSGKVTVRQMKSPFDPKKERYGHRNNDYWQPIGLLESKADIAIAVDSDLLVVNDKVRSIIPLVSKFGMCLPVNGRHIVWRDAMSTCDGGPVQDETEGMGMCCCTAFIAFSTASVQFRPLLKRYAERVVEDAMAGIGARGPLSLWRAMWDTGIHPVMLPVQWCVTGSNLGDAKAKGRTLPVILHWGHESVQGHYRELIG